MTHDVETDPFEEPRLPLLQRLVWFPWWFAESVHEWWETRRWMRLIEGLPAIVLAVITMLPWGMNWFSGSAAMVDRYRAELNQAIATDDSMAADVYVRRLLQFDSVSPEVRFARAFVAERQGRSEEAEAILTDLANHEHGHPKAHLWMAKRLASVESNRTPEIRAKMIKHLHAALDDQPPPSEANIMLGRIYLDEKDYRRAISCFEAVVEQHPEFRIELGQLHQQLNDNSAASREFERAARHFQDRVEKNPNDLESRVVWARAVRLQGDFRKATQIVKDGLRSDPDNVPLRNLFASIAMDEFDALPQSEDRLTKRLILLEEALQEAPDHPDALSRLARFCTVQGEAGDRARGKLKDILAIGKATATVHAILGVQAMDRGDKHEAALHFEQGYRLDPNVPSLLANFALLLANSEPPQMDRALTLVNRALESTPDDPVSRETRGRIFMKMGRWKDALADLEFALPHKANDSELHATLAEVYEKLGDQELAERHRQRSSDPNEPRQ